MDQILSIMPKNFDEFWKPEAWGQKVLPDRLVLMGQKLKENSGTAWLSCWRQNYFTVFKWKYPFRIHKGDDTGQKENMSKWSWE